MALRRKRDDEESDDDESVSWPGPPPTPPRSPRSRPELPRPPSSSYSGFPPNFEGYTSCTLDESLDHTLEGSELGKWLASASSTATGDA